MHTLDSQESDREHGDLLRCSFCKKHAEEVAHLLAGPHVHICNSCVDLCREILQTKHSEYQPLNEVQEIQIPSRAITVSDAIKLLAKYHFDTQVKFVLSDVE